LWYKTAGFEEMSLVVCDVFLAQAKSVGLVADDATAGSFHSVAIEAFCFEDENQPSAAAAAAAKAKVKGKAAAAKGKGKAKPKAKAQPRDNAGIDDADVNYSVIRGQWILKTVANVSSKCNWRHVFIMNTAFGPCAWCENFFQKGGTGTRTSKMLTFVTDRCARAQSVYDSEMLSDAAFDNLWAPLVLITEDAALPTWIAIAVMQALELSTDFYRRFTVQCGRFPRKLCWLVKKTHNELCNS
jgi:hypothetical protein